MGGNLGKTPLTAVVFAALLSFLAVFMPFSEQYQAARRELVVPLSGNLFMIAYGLWLSVTIVIIFAGAVHKGIKLILFAAIPILVSGWLVPMLPQIMFGETTNVMLYTDSLFELARGCAATLLLVVLLYLLRTPEKPQPANAPPPPKPAEKVKLKRVNLSIMLLGLPVIYTVIYFLVWYFVLWRSEAVRVYYNGSSESINIMDEIMGRQLPMAVVKGFLYALSLIPLLFQLSAKRVSLVLASVMVFLGAAVQMLIPSPVMPAGIQRAHLVQLLIELAIYGVISSLLLYLCVRREDTSQPAPKAAPPGQRPPAPPPPAGQAKK